MNREIKFRGKTEPDGHWVYGSLISRRVFFGWLHWITYQESVDKKNELWSDCEARVKSETVGQYTGSKDKNGVKIFEGDVVNMHQFLFDGSEHETAITGVIKQGDYGWTLSRIKNKEVNDYMGYENGEGETYLVDFYGLHDESFEVIGNEWDNPELLEVLGDE